MNLELLLFSHSLGGKTRYREIALKHANRTMQEHIRANGSSYHVVNYNPQTGNVQTKYTHQGAFNESTCTSQANRKNGKLRNTNSRKFNFLIRY